MSAAITVALVFASLAPALAIGGAHVSTQLAVAAIAGLIAIALRFDRRADLGTSPRSLFYVAAFLPVIVCLLQLVPVPPSLLAWITEESHALRRSAGESSLVRAPISLSPPATFVELAKGVGHVALFAAASSVFRERRRALLLAQAFFFGGAAIAVLGLVSAKLGTPELLGFYRPRSTNEAMGPFVNANHAAAFQLMVVFVGWGVFVCSGRTTRIAVALVGLAPLAVLVVSHSRGAAVALALTVLFVAQDRIRSRKVRALLLFGVVCSATAAAWSLRSLIVSDPKLLAWRVAANVIAAHPWTGVGRGAFAEAATRFNPPGVVGVYSHAECYLLQIAAELGVPCAILIFVMAVLALREAWRIARKNPPSPMFAAAVIAVAVQNLFDFNLELAATSSAGAVLLGASIARDQERAGMKRSAIFGIGALAVVVSALALCRLVSSDLHRSIAEHPADHHLALTEGARALRRDPAHALEHLERARALHPNDPRPYVLSARAFVKLGNLRSAASSYRAAFERGLAPTAARFRELLAGVGSAARASAAVPDDPPALLVLGSVVENELGDRNGAAAIYLRAMELSPESAPLHVDALRGLVRLDVANGAFARRLAERSPDALDVTRAAEALIRAGRAEEAGDLFLALQDKHRSDFEVVGGAARALLERGARDESVRLLAELSRDPRARQPDVARALALLEEIRRSERRYLIERPDRISLDPTAGQ